MLEPGCTIITREHHACAGAAFAILDQIVETEAAR
jgi:hypothetical protein